MKLQPKLLHVWTKGLADLLAQEFNITIPSRNYPPILWKYITAMSFPLETYSIATRIATLLEITEFRLTREKWEKSGGFPDAKLMGLLIIACKLGFNLEKSTTWKDWAIATHVEEGNDLGVEMDEVTQTDILSMSAEKLDEYMDWIQSKWINEDPEFEGILYNLLSQTKNC